MKKQKTTSINAFERQFGSTLKITSCAIALMLMLGIPFDFPTILGFVLMLGVTMVAAPGVPGDGTIALIVDRLARK